MGELVYTDCFENNYNKRYREFESYIICFHKKDVSKNKRYGFTIEKKIELKLRFCLHNPQKYANLTVSNRQIKYATTAILSKVNTYSNRLLTVRNSKTAVVYSKLIQQQQAYKNTRFYQKQMLKRTEAAFYALSSLKSFFKRKLYKLSIV